MWHWLGHLISWTWGGEGQGGANSTGYLITSGPLPDLTMLGLLVGVWRHLNCHTTGCKRIGHRVHGTSYRACRRHHPLLGGDTTVQDIWDAHERSQRTDG